MKLQESKRGQYYMTIPKQIVKMMGWKKKTELTVMLNDVRELVIKRV